MKREEIYIDDFMFIKTTPKDGYELVKFGTNEHYSEAIDLPNSNFEYTEVKKPEEVLDEQQPNDIGE